MNKAGIRNQFLALLNRNDCTNELADTFIDQSVARIQRTLRVPPMERGELITTNKETGGTIVLPEDFLEMKYLYAGGRLLEYVDIGRYLAAPSYIGAPNVYTRIQGELKLKPTPPAGTEVTMIYYGEVPDLVNDTDDNYFTVAAPDLVVYGALTYAADYFVDERKPLFEETFARIYAELTEQALSLEMNTSGMAIAPAYNMEY